MSNAQRLYIFDLLERIFWTLLQAASAEGIVNLFGLDQSLLIPIAGGLALVKGLVAKYVGAKDTAATLTASADTPATTLEPVKVVDPLDQAFDKQ